MKCNKCEKELNVNDKFCSECGWNLADSVDTITDTQALDQIKENKLNKFKKIYTVRFMIIISILLIAAISAFAYVYNVKLKNDKRIYAEKLLEAEQDYQNRLIMTTSKMYATSNTAGEMGSTIISVWGASIKMTLDADRLASAMGISVSDVYKNITKENYEMYYSFQGNFNKAISRVNQYYTNTGKTLDINKTKDEIESEIKLLNNPPDNFIKAYEEAFKMYGSYIQLCDSVVFPSGSLISYREQVNQLVKSIETSFTNFKARLPNKK